MAKATIEAIDREPVPPGSRGSGPRRIRVSIRRVNPWSVLKVSLVLYLCLMLVVLVGLWILYGVLDAVGLVDWAEELLTGLWGGGDIATGPNDPVTPFQVDIGYVIRTLFLVGLISTVLWAAFTVFLAFLYNLIADLIGGVEVTLVERR